MRISVGDVLSVVKEKLFLSILIGVILAVASFSYFKFVVNPTYTSDTKVYVLSGTMTTSGNKRVTSNDVLTYAEVVKDLPDVVKSRSVANAVIKNMGLDTSPDRLAKKINVTYSEDSRVITIAVSAGSPEMAKRLADEVTDAATMKVNEIYGTEITNIVDTADLPQAPSSPNVTRNTFFAFCAGFCLTIAVALVISCANDTVKSEDDVVQYLGLSVLGVVPAFNKNARKA